MLRVELLGAPQIEWDGHPLQVDTRKAIALLAYLAVTAVPHRRDSLVGLLWPDTDPGHGRAALRRTLSVLGKGLDGRWLVAGRETISLDRHDLDLDVDRFHQLARGSGAAELEQAVRLHRGDFLAGFGLRDSPEFDDWQYFEAESLRRERADALGRLVARLGAQGELTRATNYARQWVDLDPLHEAAHRELIRLYAWAGDRAAAITQYRECVRVLDRELGVGPLAETTAVYESVNADVIAPAPAAPGPAAHARPAARPMVGRDAEWQAAREHVATVGHDGALLVIEGEAGIGKTRLADELVAHAIAGGAPAVVARGHEGEEQLAYGVITDALRAAARSGQRGELTASALAEAGRLVPELGEAVGPPPPLDGPGGQARMLDGIARVLTASASVLVFDDLQWADEASLDAVNYLVRRLRGRPLCVVLMWRTERVPPDHRLRRLVAEVTRQGFARTILLGRLGPEDVAELGALDEAIARRLHAETGGLPFFLVAYLDEAAAGRLQLDAAVWAVPGGVRDLLRSRVSTLSETGRQVVAAAAAIGGRFDPAILRAASGRSEDEMVGALEELLSGGYVAELPGQQGYDFTHPRIRALVYEETSLARRRLLHRRVAEALRRGPGVGPAAVVANHYRLAGEDAAAAGQFAAAGYQAARLFANAEALAHFDTALALGHPDRGPLHEAIGDLHTLAGRYDAALTAYESAAADGRDVEQKLGQVHHRRGHWDLAEHHLRAALDSAAAAEVRARVQVDRSLTAHRRGDAPAAEALAADALRLAESAGDTAALAQARNLLGILASSRGDHADARTHLEHSLALAAGFESPSARVAALNNLALACAAAGDLSRALDLAAEALELEAAHGDRHRQAALHNNLADLLHAAGRDREAIPHLTEAARLFAEVDDHRLREPEIWKLVEW